MESSDERATAQLIAERTLALAGVDLSASPEPGKGPRRGRLVLLLSATVSVAAAGLGLWWWQGRDAAARTEPGAAATSPGAAGGDDRTVGYLNCNSWPSASVLVDGRRLPGMTPLRGVKLPVGAHTLVLVSGDGLSRKEVQVNILPAQTRTIAVALDR